VKSWFEPKRLWFAAFFAGSLKGVVVISGGGRVEGGMVAKMRMMY
jgi:hypothetical protein